MGFQEKTIIVQGNLQYLCQFFVVAGDNGRSEIQIVGKYPNRDSKDMIFDHDTQFFLAAGIHLRHHRLFVQGITDKHHT